MFVFIKKVFIVAKSFFSCNALKCVLINNQEWKIRLEIKGINRNEPLFCPCSLLVKKCSRSCNDPHVKLCVIGAVKKHKSQRIPFYLIYLKKEWNKTYKIAWN